MPDDIGYLKEYLNEYERVSTGLRKAKIRRQVKKELGLIKRKPLGKRFQGLMGSRIRFG